MNKRNELRAKLQARHQQQTRQANIPKAKRPAVVAALSATAPKKQKLERPVHLLTHPPLLKPNVVEQQQQQFVPTIPQSQFGASSILHQVQQQQQLAAGPSTSTSDELLVHEEFSVHEDTSSDSLFNKGDSFFEDANADHPHRPDEWLYSSDPRHIEHATSELSLDKALQFFHQPDVSMEASARLISIISSSLLEISTDVDQIRSLITPLRALRLKGVQGAESLLMALVSMLPDTNPMDMQQFFTRPPPSASWTNNEVPTKTMEVPSVQQLLEQMGQIGEFKGSEAPKNRKEEVKLADKCWTNVDELLKLLVSGEMDAQKSQLLVVELLDNRPDVLDLCSPNFADQVHSLFSSKSSIAFRLASQIANFSATAVIKKAVPLLLTNFDPSLFAPLVINFVAMVCKPTSRSCLLITDRQCFVLALYVLEEVSRTYKTELSDDELASSKSMVQFTDIVNFLIASKPGKSSETLFQCFRHQYRAHVEALRTGAPSAKQKKHCTHLFYRILFQKYPELPAKCCFGGVLPPNSTHISVEQFDRALTVTINEIFELVTKLGKGAEADAALDRMHNLLNFYRRTREAQFVRHMPLLATRMQNLLDALASQEIKNTPACSLLLYSLDMFIEVLAYQTDLPDGDVRAITTALHSQLQFLQMNRRKRQIPLLCSKACSAVIQLLKSRLYYGKARQLISANHTLLNELIDWKALNIGPDRALLKRELMTLY